MASRVCWRCENKAHMTLIDSSVRVKGAPGESIELVQGAFTCDACSILNLGFQTRSIHHRYDSQPADFLIGADLVWLPASGQGRECKDVPERIAGAASEAYEVASIGAYRAAAVLARSVVEATAKEKGVTSGKLQQKIEKMHEEHLLRDHVRDAAHEIRHLGNDMAHGDFVEPTSKEESEEVLELMSEILHEVFQSPAKVAARKQARLAKQQSNQDE